AGTYSNPKAYKASATRNQMMDMWRRRRFRAFQAIIAAARRRRIQMQDRDYESLSPTRQQEECPALTFYPAIPPVSGKSRNLLQAGERRSRGWFPDSSVWLPRPDSPAFFDLRPAL